MPSPQSPSSHVWRAPTTAWKCGTNRNIPGCCATEQMYAVVSWPPPLGTCPARRPHGFGMRRARFRGPLAIVILAGVVPASSAAIVLRRVASADRAWNQRPVFTLGASTRGGRWPGRAAPGGPCSQTAHGGGFVGRGRAPRAPYPPC